MLGDGINGADLDRHITGNYGQDQFENECDEEDCDEYDECPYDGDHRACLADKHADANEDDDDEPDADVP